MMYTFGIPLRQYIHFLAFIYLTAVVKTSVTYHFILHFFLGSGFLQLTEFEKAILIFSSYFCLDVFWKRNDFPFQGISVLKKIVRDELT